MSQNSLIIPNTGTLSGLTLVNDTNGALDTLETLNSGASAPSPTQADILWMDTAAGMLKQRDASNASWLPQALRGLPHGGGIRHSGQNGSFLTANTTLTVAQIGQLVICNPSAAINVTLPNANTVPVGTGFILVNYANYTVSMLATGGNALDPGALYGGDSMFVCSDGSSAWRYLLRGNIASQSLSATGWRRNSGGVIDQWGTATAVISSGTGSITWGETFPNNLFTCLLTIGDNNLPNLTVQGIHSTETTSGTSIAVFQSGSSLSSGTVRINFHAIGN